MKKTAFVIGAPSSGAGKTTAAMMLMAALVKRGIVVQPFKAGPDFIDPGHHTALCSLPSYNLDTWMMGREGVKKTFQRAMSGADAGVVEGVMGLFDGKDGRAGDGSTAHLSKVLGLPVILVVDAGKTAGSVAPLVYGFERFDPGVKLAGVIFNRVGSGRHFRMLEEAVEKGCSTRVLGYIPKDEDTAVPQRHLGLFTAAETESGPSKERLALLAERHIDINGLLEVAPAVETIPGPDAAPSSHRTENPSSCVRIAVALDRAFSFYYRENLDILEGSGAEIAFFSPLKDRSLPPGTDGVYIGGGYPELYASALEANGALREEIRSFALSGGPVYAECGGLMYLGREIMDLNGRRFSMVGLYPWTSRMLPGKRSLGYREVEARKGCPFLDAGQRIRGHEFHYSEITPPEGILRTYRIMDDRGSMPGEGYLLGRTLASYVHLHFASNPEFARGFVRVCRESKKGNFSC